VYGSQWADPVADRMSQVIWVLDHLDDLDADFLAIYGIDLETAEISARRYFALAHRATAYTGVMAARAEAERDDQPQPQAATPPTRTSSTAAPERADSSEVREVSLTAFRMQFPGLVSMGGG